jgi:voltage-gated potassium channel Kch
VRIGRYSLLLAALVLLIVAVPFFEGGSSARPLLNAFFTAVLLAGVHAVGDRRRQLRLAVGMVSAALVLGWWTVVYYNADTVAVAHLVRAFFYFYMVVVVMRSVLASARITVDTLIGAVCVYLLLALGWAAFYSILETWNPGSIYVGAPVNADGLIGWSEVVYFSFVTLTTLGYGDVMPVSSHARSLAVLEAVVGVLYLATLVAWLVGAYLAGTPERRRE